MSNDRMIDELKRAKKNICGLQPSWMAEKITKKLI
jgi:hypothetical protein